MRVVMLVQLVDEGDWVRGFIVTWIRELAARVEHLDVITLEQRKGALPANVTVYSMGKERGFGRPRLLIGFYRALLRVIRRADVIFCHMTPTYTWIAAPLAWLFGKPQVLWFVHRQVTPGTRLAHAAAARIVTASRESYTLFDERKVTILGHGIDLSQFRPAQGPPPDPPLILSVGRLAEIKNHDKLIAALPDLLARPGCEEARAAIVGDVMEGQDTAYHDRLYRMRDELGLGDRVEMPGAVPYREMPALYRQAAVTVNLCPTGGMDKAVLESLASGVPVLVHNRTFLPLLGDDADLLWVDSLEPEAIAGRLAAILTLPAGERAALTQRLAERVHAEYGLPELMDRLVAVLADVTEGRIAS